MIKNILFLFNNMVKMMEKIHNKNLNWLKIPNKSDNAINEIEVSLSLIRKMKLDIYFKDLITLIERKIQIERLQYDCTK